MTPSRHANFLFPGPSSLSSNVKPNGKLGPSMSIRSPLYNRFVKLGAPRELLCATKALTLHDCSLNVGIPCRVMRGK